MPTLREDVERLIADGWAVVPIVAGKKNPEDTGWLKKTYTSEHFPEGANVGVKCGSLSGWRVDVDLDALEGVAAGQTLLPNTGMIHGRPGKPASHHWFVCTGIKTHTFKDLDGTMLVELRADGGQTVVPPSVHASGDVLRWERNASPLTIAPDDLLNAVRAVAIAALFARHWPSGSRHVAAGHLAGFLLRVGFDGPWTVQIIRTAATIAKDEEVEDRARIAKDTAAKHANGEKTTGGPKLAELFGRGEELAARVYQWMGREGDDLLDRLNEKHFVAEYGSDTVVGTESTTDTLMIQDFESFRRRYYNQFVGKKKLGEWWLSHAQQRRYRKIVFAPPPLVAHPEDYNTWRGFSIAPDPNPHPELRCRRYLEHLYTIICDGIQEHFEFLLDVCALTCQFPGRPTGVAVVLRGDSGAGKGSFVDTFGPLFGIHYIQVDKQDHVTGRFNQHLANKVVLFADEAVWAGNKQDAGALKRLVTERTLTIERKFMDAVIEPNCLHLFMATNERWVWPATMNERRGFILNVYLKEHATKEYFNALHEEWQNGGNAAFLAFCLQRKVPGDRLGPLPRTEGLMEQQQMSLDGMHQWWLEKLLQGEIGYGVGWPTFLPSSWVYEDYLRITSDMGAKMRRSTEMQLCQDLQSILPPSSRRRRRLATINTTRYGAPNLVQALRWGWDIPDLATCRAFFEKKVGVPFPWPPADAEQVALPEGDDDDTL